MPPKDDLGSPGPSKPNKLLRHMKTIFEKTEDYSNFRLNITASFRLRSDRFQGGDILLRMKIRELHKSSTILATDILLGVYNALDQLIEKLKSEFDDSEKRMVFIDVQSLAFTVPLFLGSFDLHNEQSLADLTMQSLAKILQSFQTLSCKCWIRV